MSDTIAATKNLYHGFAYGEQFSSQMDLPEFRSQHKTYLIASTPRCGSHFLGHGLMQLGVFGVPLEYLNGGNLRGWKIKFGLNKDLPELLMDIISRRTSPSGWFGIKAHWSQFSPHLRKGNLSAINPIERILFIYRRDLLGQAISYLKAQQTGIWISGAPRKGTENYDFKKNRSVR